MKEAKVNSDLKQNIKYPKIYIVILNYNTWADTIECLESVLRNDYPNYQLVVVDNNSPNNSMKYIKAWAEGKLDVWGSPDHPLKYLSFPPIAKPIPYVCYLREEAEKGGNTSVENRLVEEVLNTKKESFKFQLPRPTTEYPLIFIQTGANLGFAGGNNVAVKMLLNRKEDGFIFFLNSDIVIRSNVISSLINCVKNNKCIYGLKVLNYKEPDNVLFIGGAKVTMFGTVKFIRHVREEKRLDYISGGALFTNIRNFNNIGLLPEEYFLYWEDADWCTEAKEKGFDIKICEKAICYDKGGASIGRDSKNAAYYYTQGSLKFQKKYKRRLLLLATISFHTIRAFYKLFKKRDISLAIFKALMNINRKVNYSDKDSFRIWNKTGSN